MRPVLASPDSQAMVMLCTRLALPKGADGPKPLSLVEWNHLAVRIARSEWQRPGALLGRAAGELHSTLGLGLPQAQRVARLLDRGGQLALEVERLADRGIWILTRADEDYPARWRQRLRGQAPAVCFGAGERELLGHGGLAVVGSRNVDEAGETFARFVGERCASCGLLVVSGAARGVDRAAMTGALAAGGRAVGVVASSLEAILGHRETRSWLLKGTLTLLAPNSPANRFTVGGAMARNKLIYCLADWAMVVACDADKGGTRAGALENLRHRWVPLFVRADPAASAGNRMLLESGAMPVTPADLRSCPDLRTLLAQRAASPSAPPAPEARLAGAGEPEPPTYPQAAMAPCAAAIPKSGTDMPQSATLPDEPVDLFLVAWPLIQQRLHTPRGERELAALTGLQPAQLRAWLRRALAEGLVQRTGRKYVSPAAPAPGTRSRGARSLPDRSSAARPFPTQQRLL